MNINGRVKYSALVNVAKLQALMDSFSEVIGIANAVIDVDGVVITCSGWQDACTAFHRVNAQSCQRCIESDTSLAGSMTQGAPFAIYRCYNGLVDAAAPIVLSGRHVANVFTGQLLTQPPDFEFFRAQARRFGYDEAAYLDAIRRVPVVSPERLESITRLYAQVAAMLADNSLAHAEQMKAAAALAELNKNLEVKISVRTRALEHAYEKLAERERALRESDGILRAILETTLDGYWRIDCQGKLLDVNATYCQLSGYTREELIGMRVFDLDAAKSAAELFELIGHITKEGHAQFDSMHRRKDGTLWPAEISTIYRDAGNGEIVAFFRDISRRRLAEEARMASEHRFRDVVDTTDGIVWELDARDLAFSFISQKAERLLGYSVEDLLKPGFWKATVVHPEDRSWMDASFRHFMNRLQPFSLEHRFVGREGNTGWFRAIATIVREDGTPRWLRGILVDITEQKRREAELMEARAAAETANNAKSRFLAAASHDLRQPLSALSLLVGLLGDEGASVDPELLRNIQGCVDSLTELLTDLLDISKLEAGAVKPVRTHFSIADLLDALASIFGREAKLKGLELRTRCACEGIYSDAQLLRRIVGNLVANAIRYTEQGGLLIACRRHQGRRWIEVWDTGIGIPADKMGVIFDEFSQLGDEARNRGSGLGLSIVQKTAALLGLGIRVRSRLGHGSMFAIELPAESGPEHEQAMEEPAACCETPCRIGVVDDNARVLESIVRNLSRSGHEVVAASNGRALIESLGSHAPDIIVSDYRLADRETGFDVITAVRKVFGQNTPAMLLTGDTSPGLIRSMADRGIPVLYKPLRGDTLRTAISEAIGRGRA